MIAHDDIFFCPARKYFDALIHEDTVHLSRWPWVSRKLRLSHAKALERMREQIIDNFGLPDDQKYLFNKKKTLLIMICEYYIKHDESLLPLIEISQRDIDSVERKIGTGDEDLKKAISSNIRMIQKWSGRDPKSITVYEYYNDTRDYQTEQIRLEQERKRKHAN